MAHSPDPDLFAAIQSALGSTFAIERELGGGGMSRVFLAEERRLHREIVIKVLMPELAASVSADRFLREVQLAAQLQQANIVPVLSTGEANGLPYYTMPFVGGKSLRALLDGTPQLPVAQTIDILFDVAKALSFAHELGVVHRDIKPGNILLSGGTAVVTDFGIAKALSVALTGGAKDTLTKAGMSLGTAEYMAPEQAMGDPNIDHRADLYALGIVAYEMLAGEPPFTAASLRDLVRAHVMDTPVSIATRRFDVPPALVEAIAQCLAKSPDDRPPSAGALLEQLRVARRQSTTRAEVVIDPAPAAAPSSTRRANWWRFALIVGAVIVGATAIYAWRWL